MTVDHNEDFGEDGHDHHDWPVSVPCSRGRPLSSLWSSAHDGNENADEDYQLALKCVSRGQVNLSSFDVTISGFNR